MNRNSEIIGLCRLSLCIMLLTAPAQAQELFATFSQVGQNPSFAVTSTGTGISLGLSSAIPVNFQYQTPNGLGAGIGESLSATMTMSSASAAPSFNNSGFLVQPLKDIELRFTSNGAPANSGDLLRVFLTTGNLLARPGGQTARLTGTESATATSVVNFSSDYLDFSQPLVNKNFSISFTSVAPEVSQGNNGFLAPFNATATGNFGSNPLPNNIPEPRTFALITLGGLTLARRRKPR